MTDMEPIQEIEKRMQSQDLPELTRKNFLHYYKKLAEGETGLIDGAMIEPVADLPDQEKLGDFKEQGRAALRSAVMIKLNGGLGTSMGLEQAKSLLPVKDDLNFLDIIARQVVEMRKDFDSPLQLMLMNSYNTDKDTLASLQRHPELQQGQTIRFSFLQNKVPKIRQSNLHPVSWPEDPDLEWCPPGHGDIYTALTTSGMLDELLRQGIEYAFVSNSDNLGAVMDLDILGYFAEEGLPFLMEVADRTEADKKGGHLARMKDGNLVLRESAQCPEDELEDFQNTDLYSYFNTNNLWINLKSLQEKLDSSNGILELPLIRNSKTVDPTDKSSPAVYQLETAMGAAISVFEDAGALRVPRSRFAPVKTTEDLLVLWSDCYVLNDNYVVAKNPARKRGPISVDLDDRYYKLISDFRERFPHGSPSLLECEHLEIRGDVRFGKDVKVVGKARIESDEPRMIPEGSVVGEI